MKAAGQLDRSGGIDQSGRPALTGPLACLGEYPEIVDHPVFEYDGGYVEVPTDPGLGIEIDEEHVRSQTNVDHNWHNPV